MKKGTERSVGALKVLVYGNMGTGKTTFAGTFPKPAFLDFDKGTTSLNKMKVEYGYEDFDGVPRHEVYMKALDEVEAIVKGGEYETIVLDSATTLGERVMDHVLHLNNRSGQRPQMQDYLDQMLKMQELFARLTTSGLNIVVIAHVQLDKDEITGKTFAFPLITGKLAQKISIYFDEVYYSEAETNKDGATKYKLLTSHTTMFPARSRLGLEGHIEPDYKNLILDKKVEEVKETEAKKVG